MPKIQLDIPDEIDYQLSVYKAMNKHATKAEAILKILEEAFDE